MDMYEVLSLSITTLMVGLSCQLDSKLLWQYKILTLVGREDIEIFHVRTKNKAIEIFCFYNLNNAQIKTTVVRCNFL